MQGPILVLGLYGCTWARLQAGGPTTGHEGTLPRTRGSRHKAFFRVVTSANTLSGFPELNMPTAFHPHTPSELEPHFTEEETEAHRDEGFNPVVKPVRGRSGLRFTPRLSPSL